MVEAIPGAWKRMLRENDNLRARELIWVNWISLPKVSKLAYWQLIESKRFTNDATGIRWEIELKTTFTKEKWEKLCKRHIKVTICTRLRLLQYKITQKALITNIKLNMYGIKDTMNCEFCKNEIETIVHLFWECPVVRKLWQQLVLLYKITIISQRK